MSLRIANAKTLVLVDLQTPIMSDLCGQNPMRESGYEVKSRPKN